MPVDPNRYDMDRLARRLFMTAIRDGQEGELLQCLFDGGSATIDARTGKLVMVTEDLLKQFHDPPTWMDEGVNGD